MKYGLLLSGGINEEYNKKRYACDLGLAYQVLCEQQKVLPDHISVFYADGRPVYYLDKKITTKVADGAAIRNHLAELSEMTTVSDELWIVISNHGGGGQGGIVCLWDETYMTLEEFVNLLNKIACRKFLVLGQCYAGNILNLPVRNALVLTANKPDCVSYARIYKEEIQKGSKIYQYEYDEFLYQFFSCLKGSYPDGDPLGEESPICSDVDQMVEYAYEYAKKSDCWNPDHPEYTHLCERIRHTLLLENPVEIPQMKKFA